MRRPSWGESTREHVFLFSIEMTLTSSVYFTLEESSLMRLRNVSTLLVIQTTTWTLVWFPVTVRSRTNMRPSSLDFQCYMHFYITYECTYVGMSRTLTLLACCVLKSSRFGTISETGRHNISITYLGKTPWKHQYETSQTYLRDSGVSLVRWASDQSKRYLKSTALEQAFGQFTGISWHSLLAP